MEFNILQESLESTNKSNK